MQSSESVAQRIIRLPQVKGLTGLSRASIYAKMKEEKFPRPISLGARSVGWVEREVAEWITSRIESSRNA